MSDLSRIESALEALLEAQQQLLERISSLEQRLYEQPPERAYAPEAARRLGMSTRTLQRRRSEWLEGVHWWMDAGRPVYNLVLILDGQRQGFDSGAHHRACQAWLKAQPGQRQSRRRA